MKAADEIGWGRLFRFAFFTLAMVPYRLALVPPLRRLWLRLLGARIGARTILHDVRFFNLYRRGPRGLEMGNDCFVGDECLLDLMGESEIQERAAARRKVRYILNWAER